MINMNVWTDLAFKQLICTFILQYMRHVYCVVSTERLDLLMLLKDHHANDQLSGIRSILLNVTHRSNRRQQCINHRIQSPIRIGDSHAYTPGLSLVGLIQHAHSNQLGLVSLFFLEYRNVVEGATCHLHHVLTWCRYATRASNPLKPLRKHSHNATNNNNQRHQTKSGHSYTLTWISTRTLIPARISKLCCGRSDVCPVPCHVQG